MFTMKYMNQPLLASEIDSFNSIKLCAYVVQEPLAVAGPSLARGSNMIYII